MLIYKLFRKTFVYYFKSEIANKEPGIFAC